MSHHHALPVPTRSKPKRLRTKRERNAAKFGPKAPLGGSRRAPTQLPRWLQPPPWGGLLLGSPLGPPKPVVITQNRLCHRGIFKHQVKSLDVRRLLTPVPGKDEPPPAPQIEEGDVLGVPAEGLKELVAALASLLGSFGAFSGRDLVGERRRGLLAVLRRHRRGAPDLGVFLAHRTPAQPPAGQSSPPAPRAEGRSRPPGGAVGLGGWALGEPPAGTPSPLRAVETPPPRPPSPIFGAPRREPESPFPWRSAEDEEEEETPGGLPQSWGGSPGGFLPPPPRFWGSPQPPQQQQEEEEDDEGWTPFAPPDPPPWGAPQSRPPRPSRPPKTWRAETPWDPPRPPWDPPRAPWDPPRAPWDSPPSPRLLWDPPDPSRTPPSWSPDPPRPLWDPPNPSRPPWDPRPRSPDPPRPPRTPPLWYPDPPRPLWDPPDAPRPLWDSPDPPRSPQPWSPRPLWDPPAPPRPSRDPPGAPQAAMSRCCCRHPRLYRDMPPPPRDPPQRCPQPPKRRRRRPDWGGVAGWGGEGVAPPPPPPLPPSWGCGCPCRGRCWGGGGSEVRRGL